MAGPRPEGQGPTMRSLVIVVLVTVVAESVRWFVRTANGAKGYGREPLPRSIVDYRVQKAAGPCRRKLPAL